MKTFIVAIVVLILQQNIHHVQGATCASNPCSLDGATYSPATGYNCYDVPGTTSDSVCTCPNNVAPVLNGPCRTITPAFTSCNRTCANGGVCNIVNGQQVCWCLLGYAGSFCELQGLSTRCTNSPCISGTCFEKAIGTSLYAYCQCTPGYTGPTCHQCYFQCSAVGVFPDTAFCNIGRYFYCAQASGAPIVALCPDGQRFNRLTNQCDANYNCT